MTSLDRLFTSFCNFSATRPWMLAAIICACIVIGAAIGGPVS